MKGLEFFQAVADVAEAEGMLVTVLMIRISLSVRVFSLAKGLLIHICSV